MLGVIEELLDWEFEGLDFGISEDIPRDAIEALSQYVKEDYYNSLTMVTRTGNYSRNARTEPETAKPEAAQLTSF